MGDTMMRRLPILIASLSLLLPCVGSAQMPNPALSGAPFVGTSPANSTLSNVTAATGRAALGAAAGNGVNLMDPKYGADNTGVANNDTPLQNAVNDACNNASPIFQAKEVFIPDGIYAFSPVALINITNACWIHGSHPLIGGTQGGATLRIGTGIASDFLRFRAVGQLKVTDLRIDMSAGQQVGAASYCRVQAGGAGYAVNDTIVLAGGTSTLATTLRVTNVSAGAVTGCVIAVPGGYSVAPPPVSAVAQGSSSGAGAGATFNMIYAASAAISISGPTTSLTVAATSGATVLTVGSCLNFGTGDAVAVEQDDGNYKSTTVSSCTGTTLTLAAGLSFGAGIGHPVYDKYASDPLIDNVVIVGFWDGIRVENAGFVTVRNAYIQDYSHDGIIKINGANPIVGADRYQLNALDLNLGTSSAGVEMIAGGDVAIGERSKLLGSNFGVLLNTYFTLTGTLLIENNSLEQNLSCAVRLHQSVATKEYHNVIVVGNEFSALATSAQHFCVDAGTANTSPKWINLINFSHNSGNSSVASGVNMVQILDGDVVVIEGNTLYNNSTAGPNAIAVGGAATNVLEAGNVIVGYPTGNYGTMTAGSLATFSVRGGLAPVVKVSHQTFTATGTYTPAAGIQYATAECVGGGGGGGGSAASAAGDSGGGGGGGGSYSSVRLTAAQIGASQAITIPAASGGGATGNNPGTAGGDVSLGALLVCKGGSAGGGAAANSAGAGGAGGIAGTGDLTGTGEPGRSGLGASITTITIPQAQGGSTVWGGSAVAGSGVSAAAQDGTAAAAGAFGAGGNGGIVSGSASTAAGGSGAKGFVLVTEYTSQ